MAITWIKTPHKGLRYYEHETRKNGRKADRYYSIRFKVNSKDYTYGVGWWSEGIPDEARQNNPGMGFEEYCLSQIRLYKSNVKDGSGPKSPKERRKIASEKEVQELEAQAKLEIENKTFTQYFENTYYPKAKTQKKESSYKKEEEHFRIWLEPEMGKMPFKKITHNDLERVKKNMQDTDKAPRTIQYVLATFRQVWNHARRDGLVSGDSPTHSVKVPKFDNKRKRFLNRSEVSTLFKALKEENEQVFQIFIVSISTGFRVSEITNLKWGCIDTDRGIITVMDDKSVVGGTINMTELLKTMFLDMPRGKNNELVFPNTKGKAHKEIPDSFDRVVKRLKLNEGVDDRRLKVCFHTARHSFASLHAEAGTNIYVLSKLMRHGSIALTERYAHLTKEALQNATKNIEGVIADANMTQNEKEENTVTAAEG